MRGNRKSGSHAGKKVAKAMKGFETSLGAGNGLKAIDYLRLLEIQEDSGEEHATETTIQWSGECE